MVSFSIVTFTQASDSDDKETKDLTMWARKYL